MVAVSEDSETPPHFLNHRKRLRQRFLADDGKTMADYELLELLLCAAIPRRDVKPLAKALLQHYGTLARLMAANVEELRKFPLFGEQAIVLVKLSRELASRLLWKEATKDTILSGWQSVLDYCRINMAHEKTEQLRILFLNNRNALIRDEVMHKGSINHTPVYPREIAKRALELEATALIMVHNHPSGDPTLSGQDISMTKEVKDVLARLSIDLHDHLIIAGSDYVSLRHLGLMTK